MIEIGQNETILSDLDDTLIDSESYKAVLYNKAIAQAVQVSGIIEHNFTHVPGFSATNPIKAWAEEIEEDTPEKKRRFTFLESFLNSWNQQQDAMYLDRDQLNPFYDSQAFLQQLNPPKSALVSSNPEKRLCIGLETLNWRHHFSQVIGYDSSGVTAKKPDPSMYLTGSKRLGANPQDCFVIEDSLSGVRSGISAGANKVILVHRSEGLIQPNLQQFVAQNSDKIKVISSLEQISFVV